MERLVLHTPEKSQSLTKTRAGETKLGEKVITVTSLDQIAGSSATYVLLAIPEDIGVRANMGIGGAQTAWEPALQTLLNIQSTNKFSGEELLVLGYFDFSDLLSASDTEQLRTFVSFIDDHVFPIIQHIVASGKIPIVIGGGHNNAFPIIKGVSLAHNKAIHTINIDAHADFRALEGRHSGNGFSYAMYEGYLAEYTVIGLHENYNAQSMLNNMKATGKVKSYFFEDMLRNPQQGFQQIWLQTTVVGQYHCGLEIDLDCIQGLLSSAMGPSGFQLNEIRASLYHAKRRFAYLHLCEGAIQLANGNKDALTAKSIAYLVSDFIKAQSDIAAGG